MNRGAAHVEVAAGESVAAPAPAAWDVLTDWERHHGWMLATRARGTAAAGRAVGGGIEARTGFGPIAVRDTMTITAWEPPRRCEVEHTGRVVRGTGAFEVVPLDDDSCRVVWSERLEPPFGVAGRLGWVVIRPLVLWGLRTSLRRLARLVEAGA